MRAITVLSGGMGGAQVPPGPPARNQVRNATRCRRRRRGHRHRQHCRRPVDPRAQGVPRPRHRHVHAGRRDRPRARLGPTRRDVERQGRARGVRRGADLVRPRRPRRRHPPGPHPDARRGLPALRRDRGAVPALAARRAAAPDDRRPGRDPRRDRRPRLPQRPPGRALPGVLGATARRGPRRDRDLRRARRGHARAGGDRRDHRRRPGGAPAVEPGRLGRHHPRRPAGPRGPGRDPGAGGRPVPHRRRHPRPRHGRADAHLDRRRGERRRGRAALRRRAPTAGSWTAGWSTSRTRGWCPRSRPAGSRAAPYP